MSSEEVCRWLEDAIADSEAANSPKTLSQTNSSSGSPPTDPQPALETEPSSTSSLATVRYINDVDVLTNHLRILTIDGWKVVTDKNRHFSPGDFVLFLRPGAFLPRDAPQQWVSLFAQVGPETEVDNQLGYKVETSEWHDQAGNKIISEGYVFHLSQFPHIDAQVRDAYYELNTKSDELFSKHLRSLEFSANLGIKKWDSPRTETQPPNQMEEAEENDEAAWAKRQRLKGKQKMCIEPDSEARPEGETSKARPKGETSKARPIESLREREEWINKIYKSSKSMEEMRDKLLGLQPVEDESEEDNSGQDQEAERLGIDSKEDSCGLGEETDNEEVDSEEGEETESEETETENAGADGEVGFHPQLRGGEIYSTPIWDASSW